MLNIDITRFAGHSLPTRILIVVTAVGIGLITTCASAAEIGSPEDAVAEMKEMVGGVPAEMQVYPKSAIAAGWAMMKSTDLNENTVLPSKTRELIGLAVAAQIPCQYCIYYHAKAAKAAGASEEEIREAVHQASLTRHWSTVLYGNLYDIETYRSEVDAAFKK